MEGGFDAGDRVGRFRLVAPLDEGGMGRVWRAEGPSEPVAVKLLSLQEEGVRERFEREALALLRLRHPNIVRAIDYGEAADGTPFLAMELLEGQSLELRLDTSGRIQADEAVSIACAAAHGLAAAHAIGMIHRDVKPGNIFLTSNHEVKVLDFGIAFWKANDGRAPLSRLTAPGTILGTPSYMAPEQARGEGSEDERTDVWGLGACLYHMVSGREPFYAASNYLGELARILTEPPDPLPDDTPAPVASVILRALSKPRRARFASVTDFARFLRSEDAPASRIAPLDVMGALSEEVRLVSAALVEDIAAHAHAAFLEAVKRHGGVGSPLRGGGALAVFGGDEWLGDEAERAVRMALEIRGSARRVGVGTGKAVRRIDQRGVVTGEAMAAAQEVLSRTEAIADAGVVVCGETARRLEGGFTLDGAVVRGVLPGGRTLGPREVGGHEVPFVGRDDTLRELVACVEHVAENQRAAAVVLTGPPGIGKSRLRFELMRSISAARADARQLRAHGELLQGRSSFGLMRELLRGQAQMAAGANSDEAREKVQLLVASANLDPDTTRGTADFLGELLGVPFPPNPQLDAARADPRLMADRIRLACGELFEGWTRGGLVVVSVEDAQWADAASLSLLDSILAQRADRPLLVIATARPTFFVEHDALAVAHRVDLADLGDPEIGRIVECVLGRAEPAIVERAAGNPYLAEELSLSVKEGADPGKLPLTVEGAVLARLDKLAPDEKDVLKRAAILGCRFWREAIVALGEPLAPKLLGNLRRRGLCVPHAKSRLEDCEEWSFRHAVVYEVCRGLLTDDQRKKLHKAAATWLSHLGDSSPDEVADHFERAQERKRATVWWLRAVHSAHARGHSHDVSAFSTRLLTIAESDLPSSELFSLRMLRCEAFHWLGDQAALEGELLSLARLTEAAPQSTASVAELRRWQAEHVQHSGHLEPATFAARQAVRLADESGERDLRVRARATLTDLLVARGGLDEAAAIANEALEITKQGAGSMIRVIAARTLAHVEAERGNVSATLFYDSTARNLCIEIGAMREATPSGIGVGACLSVIGDYEHAKRILERTLKTGESLELRSVIGWVKHHLGLVLHRLGDPSAGHALEDEAAAIAGELDDVHLRTAALAYQSLIERESGRTVEALASAERALEACALHGARSAEPLCRTLRAQALVDLERYDDALTECDLAASARDEVGGMLHSEVELLLARRDALAALGRMDEAERSLRVAKRCFDVRAATIDSEALKSAYQARVPAHARLGELLASGPN